MKWLYCTASKGKEFESLQPVFFFLNLPRNIIFRDIFIMWTLFFHYRCAGTARYNVQSCGGVIWFVSFVIGPYLLCRVVKLLVKWKCGKENPFITSASFSAETSVRSPRKLLIFIIKKKNPDQNIQKTFYLILKKEALFITRVVCYEGVYLHIAFGMN